MSELDDILRQVKQELEYADGWYINDDGRLIIQDVDQDAVSAKLSEYEFKFERPEQSQ